jgi:hypothetical protein
MTFEVTLPAVQTKPAGVSGSLQWNNNGAFAGAPASTGGLYFNGASSDNLYWTCVGNPNIGVTFTLGGNSAASMIIGALQSSPQALIQANSSQGLNFNAPHGFFTFTSENGGIVTIDVLGNLIVDKVGAGFQVAEGANGMQGEVTLVGGTATVNNVNVIANSRIFLTSQQDGGTPGFLRVSSRVNNTSFTITSSNPLDTSIVAYEIFAKSDQ